jgi:gliding motility-associated-like protein
MNFTITLKHSLTVISIVLASFLGYSQPTVCLGNDTTLCVGSAVNIDNCSGQNPNNNQGILMDAGTGVTLTDDSYSGVINIGFDFDFYGNTYTQCVIGSNGVISFDLSEANGYCPWALGGVAPLPNAAFDDALHAQMPAYHDMNPSVWSSPTGEILYQTFGVAPNRQFVILYKDIYAFGGGGECSYMGVIMYETSNIFEFHLGYKPIAGGWNGGLAIQGSQNAAGTVAHITPGRNNTQWSATQEAKAWVPDAPNNTSNYTINDVPYILITSGNSTFQWQGTDGNSYPYNNGILALASVQPGTVGYFLSGQACGVSLGGVTDTTWITGVVSAVDATGTDDICSAGMGTVTATPLQGIPTYTYNWPALGSTNQTVNGVTSGTYTVEMVDGNGCLATADVTIGDTPAAFQGSTTLVSCPGGNDGTATGTMVPVIGNVTYQWDAAAGNQITQTAIGLSAGQYTVDITSDIGCVGTVTVQVTEIPGMIGNIVSQSDVTCNSGNNGEIDVNVIQGTPPYSYSWDNSISTTNIASDLYAGTHTLTITDANGCVITVTGIINEPPPLDITFLTPDTQICPEDDILLSVTGTGGSTAYTFNWFQAGVEIGTGDNITVDPDFTNTDYCVVLSEACGSPTDQECNLIYFPTPIVPSAIPDEVEKCLPGAFDFTNTSSNYGVVGIYDVTMTVTSIYGCVYVDTLFNLVEVLQNPVADFTFSSNPTTIFNTSILMQDRSSVDVIYWDWYSPGSSPQTSSFENPWFVFPQEVGVHPITLIVETERGCVDTTTLELHIVEDILFFAPNSFTPDGDEYNQIWQPSILGIDIYDFDMAIYNRWGELIWESHDPSQGWDGTYGGKLVETGTYTWVASVKSPYDDNKITYNGSINVLK